MQFKLVKVGLSDGKKKTYSRESQVEQNISTALQITFTQILQKMCWEGLDIEADDGHLLTS